MSTQPPIEDINAIVNRFQAWAGAQPPARTKNGARELTYDEAVRLRQRRRRAHKPLPDAAKLMPASTAVRHGKTKKPAKPQKRIAAPRHAKREQPVNALPPRVKRASTEPPTFRQVLAETALAPPAPASRALAVPERKTTALSLRISTAEHELLKKRAAEAGLPVSSYLRNCALEVEELRMRVNDLLSAKEPPRQLPYRGGITGRIARIFRGMFGPTKKALSLQA